MPRKIIAVHPDMDKIIREYHNNLISNGMKITMTKSTKPLAELIKESKIIYGKINIRPTKYRGEVAIKFKL